MEKVADKEILLGLDFGDKSVGVAASDALGLFSHGIETIYRSKPSKLRRTFARIGEIVKERGVSRIVVGLPLLEDGSEGVRCEKTRDFGNRLSERLGLPVVYWDERCTTIEAYGQMKNVRMTKEEMAGRVDEISAVIILQDFITQRSKAPEI